MAEQHDSWDSMRGRTWDAYKGDGSPEDSLEVLLGTLGAARRPLAEQQQALRSWLSSAAAQPAPPPLLDAVRKFLEVPSGE